MISITVVTIVVTADRIEAIVLESIFSHLRLKYIRIIRYQLMLISIEGIYITILSPDILISLRRSWRR